MIIAAHIILTGYGHWLPNDPRGSMSYQAHVPEIARLAEAHFGRRADQPSLVELRDFYRRAGPLLAHEVLWFEFPLRQLLAQALGEVVVTRRLTCYACAVMVNHIHLLIRRHRLRPDELSLLFKQEGRRRLLDAALVPADHPVFSADRCIVYKSDPQSVRVCIAYIRRNPIKHCLGRQDYPFVSPYDDWPFHKSKRGGNDAPQACH